MGIRTRLSQHLTTCVFAGHGLGAPPPCLIVLALSSSLPEYRPQAAVMFSRAAD
jgi:hypothetical protein